MIEYEDFVLNRQICRQQISNCSYNPVWCQIARWVIVAPNDQNTRVMPLGLSYEMMQIREVAVIACQTDPAFSNCMSKMQCIRLSSHVRRDWQLHIVACFTKQPRQHRGRNIVVEVQSHRLSRANSSADKCLVLPRFLYSGSFMPIASMSASSAA